MRLRKKSKMGTLRNIFFGIMIDVESVRETLRFFMRLRRGYEAENRICQNCGLGEVSRSMDFYSTKKWHRVRGQALRRDEYKCQLSWRYGKMRQAEVVHHIFPRDEFPEYQYSLWNLISLTREKHNTLHDRNTDELTEAGKELLRRTARKNGIPIPSRYE